jgi:hypothetical protein
LGLEGRGPLPAHFEKRGHGSLAPMRPASNYLQQLLYRSLSQAEVSLAGLILHSTENLYIWVK